MKQNAPIPAAQYLRSSTGSQAYSLANQADSIERYASLNGFCIVQSFEDKGRTGLTLRHRPGLRSLLTEITRGTPGFQVVLVYDVSRWGRFQDCDESGHYEFLCKNAGVHVHYCAEQFSNDETISSFTIKALKRAMAAEFSRENGKRVRLALRRTASCGFKASGTVRFGLRRLLVDVSRKPIRVLNEGEYGGTPGHRVVYTYGPPHEVECVRQMFTWALNGQRPATIAASLNARGLPWHHDLTWNADRVRNTLRNPTYAGVVIFGRSSSALYGHEIKIPSENWIRSEQIAPAIVSRKIFEDVQELLRPRPPISSELTDKDIVKRLKRLAKLQGHLSKRAIDKRADVPSVYMLKRRFGSLENVYKSVGDAVNHRFYKYRCIPKVNG